MYLVKTPAIVKPLSSQLLWKVPKAKNEIYLTFDDGPSPGITNEVLDILDAFSAKATFFCVGGNVQRFPDLYHDILQRGHSTGNHTWNHMNGWEYSDFSYYKNVLECARFVQSNLFRPPYGRISRSQASGLASRYTIVMWDVLSADWRSDVSPKQCFKNVTENTSEGSIVVFHDSEKARANVLATLPAALKFWQERNFEMKALSTTYIQHNSTLAQRE